MCSPTAVTVTFVDNRYMLQPFWIHYLISCWVLQNSYWAASCTKLCTSSVCLVCRSVRKCSVWVSFSFVKLNVFLRRPVVNRNQKYFIDPWREIGTLQKLPLEMSRSKHNNVSPVITKEMCFLTGPIFLCDKTLLRLKYSKSFLLLGGSVKVNERHKKCGIMGDIVFTVKHATISDDNLWTWVRRKCSCMS